MATERSLLGQRGETLAAEELVRQGYEIIDTNYRCRNGELDIIAWDAKTLVFVEVRSRRSSEREFPAESVNLKKQHKLVLTAMHYLSCEKPDLEPDCRFDVVEVLFQRGQQVIINVIKGAFGEN